MKKIFFLLSFALVMFAVTSCGGSGAADSPKGAVENYCNAAKNLDIKGMYAAACDQDGKALEAPEDAIKAAEEAAKSDEMKELAKSMEFTVGEEKIAEDGKTATVEVTTKIAGQEVKTSYTCIKGEDGKWRVCTTPKL